MLYLKLYETFKKNIILDLLKKSKDWKQNLNIPEHFEFEYLYKLTNDLDISITSLKHNSGDNTICCYIMENDIHNYIDSFDKMGNFWYNRKNTFGDPLEKAIKTCKDCLPCFTDREKLPSDDEITQKYFVSFEEDMQFTFREIKWGFVSMNFPNFDSDINLYKDYQEVFFPVDHTSNENPHLVIWMDNKNESENKLATIVEIKEEFESCVGKMNTEWKNIDCRLCFTGKNYMTIDRVTELCITSFMIVMKL